MEEVLTETRATVIKIYRRGLIFAALCVVLWKNAWFAFQKIMQPQGEDLPAPQNV